MEHFYSRLLASTLALGIFSAHAAPNMATTPSSASTRKGVLNRWFKKKTAVPPSSYPTTSASPTTPTATVSPAAATGNAVPFRAISPSEGRPHQGDAAYTHIYGNRTEAEAAREDERFVRFVESGLSTETQNQKSAELSCREVPLNILELAKNFVETKAKTVSNDEERTYIAKRVAKMLGIMSKASGYDTASVGNSNLQHRVLSRAPNGGKLAVSYRGPVEMMLDSETINVDGNTRYGLFGIQPKEILDLGMRNHIRNAIYSLAESEKSDHREGKLDFVSGRDIVNNCGTNFLYHPRDLGDLQNEFNESGMKRFGGALRGRSEQSLTSDLPTYDPFDNARGEVITKDQSQFWGQWLTYCPWLSFEVAYQGLVKNNWKIHAVTKVDPNDPTKKTLQTDNVNIRAKAGTKDDGFFSSASSYEDMRCLTELEAVLKKTPKPSAVPAPQVAKTATEEPPLPIAPGFPGSTDRILPPVLPNTAGNKTDLTAPPAATPPREKTPAATTGSGGNRPPASTGGISATTAGQATETIPINDPNDPVTKSEREKIKKEKNNRLAAKLLEKLKKK